MLHLLNNVATLTPAEFATMMETVKYVVASLCALAMVYLFVRDR